jgi:hypothetical protein
MLEYMIGGHTITISGEPYAAYVRIWRECMGGRNPISGTSLKLIIPIRH